MLCDAPAARQAPRARSGRLEGLGYDEAAEAALEATVKAEAGEVRRCRGRMDELASTLTGSPWACCEWACCERAAALA